MCCYHTLRRHSTINRKARGDCPSQAVIAQNPADLQLLGSCWYICSVLQYCWQLLFSSVISGLSFWLQLHAEDSASPATILSAPRQSPSCRETNALRHCLFFMPPWLDRGKAFQEHLAAAHVVLFPACLALYLKDKPFWR